MLNKIKNYEKKLIFDLKLFNDIACFKLKGLSTFIYLLTYVRAYLLSYIHITYLLTCYPTTSLPLLAYLITYLHAYLCTYLPPYLHINFPIHPPTHLFITY